MKLNSSFHKILADTLTPVHIYLKIRDKYPGSLLFESSENNSRRNAFSYICFNPFATFSYDGKEIKTHKGNEKTTILANEADLADELQNFAQGFEPSELPKFHFKANALFGYVAYDAIPGFEDIQLKHVDPDIPPVFFQAFRNLIVIDHFHNSLYLFDHLSSPENNLDEIFTLLNNRSIPQYPFQAETEETAALSHEEYKEIIEKGIAHCQRGDVFQVVLSRKFKRKFTGDDFNLYRALRSINPSPYLFYCDYPNFKIFGSSPEAQLVVEGNEARIFPIAGTFPRTGNMAKDQELAAQLQADPKENAEHVMLVDLARNDLSRHGSSVHVSKFREVEYYSHVIHLVSEVTGEISKNGHTANLLADTFPAGTLSGAPKYRALQIIDQLEPEARGLYGGAIGMLGFDGSLNLAIVIRSFLSRNQTLEFQAGAGIVSKSVPETEANEVNHKLAALRKAIQLANTL